MVLLSVGKRSTDLSVVLSDLMASTTKFELRFIARDGKSFKTITTKAQGRNAEGVMTYEKPTDCFNRACRFIDLKLYRFDGHHAFVNKV